MSNPSYITESPNNPQMSFGDDESEISIKPRAAPYVQTEAPAVIALKPPKNRNNLQQSYAFEWPVENAGWYGNMLNALGTCCGTIGTLPICFCFPNMYQTIPQGSVGLSTKFGQLYKSSDPGLVTVIPFVDKMYLCNVKLQTIDSLSPNCLTKDNVSVSITSVLYFQIVEPQTATFRVASLTETLDERVKTTLRQVMGSRNLQDVIEKREEIAEAIAEIITPAAVEWGVHVESLLIKGIEVPPGVSASLSMAAEAKRIGESKIIKAKAEVESAKLMRKAADILASKPAMQIRYLDAMQNMANTAHAKVIFMPGQSSIEHAAELSAQGGGEPLPLTSDNEMKQEDVAKLVAMNEVMQ